MSRHSLSRILHKAWLEHSQAQGSAAAECRWVVPVTAGTLETREQHGVFITEGSSCAGPDSLTEYKQDKNSSVCYPAY